MTTGLSIQHADMAQYAARVRAALADLTPDEVAELTEDLETHLGDVIAETTEPLDSRLGSPEAYAAELRQSAGLPPAPANPAAPASGAKAVIRDALAGAEEWLAQFPAWGRFRAFLPQLRPGWWVLRGVIGALLLMGLADTGSVLLFVLIAGLLCWASVALGQRTAGPPRRLWLDVLNVAVAFAGLVMFIAVADRWSSASYEEAAVYQPSQDLRNLYFYDKDGKPLRDLQVFNQWGDPVDLPDGNSQWYLPDGSTVVNVYPRPAHPDRGDWAPAPTVPPVASLQPVPPAADGTPGATATPTTPGTPGRSAVPTPTPAPTPTKAPSPPAPTPSR